MIPVNKPFLPLKEEYQNLLDILWKKLWLISISSLASNLENSLKKNLAVGNLLFVINGTIALQLAINALDLINEIITTQFLFIVTSSSIIWRNYPTINLLLKKSSIPNS